MSQMNVEQARKLLGWSQSELARRAKTSVSNIRDLENGENARPSWALVASVTAALRRGGLRTLTAEQLFPVADQQKAGA